MAELKRTVRDCYLAVGTIHDLRDECERVKGARFGAGLLSAVM